MLVRDKLGKVLPKLSLASGDGNGRQSQRAHRNPIPPSTTRLGLCRGGNTVGALPRVAGVRCSVCGLEGCPGRRHRVLINVPIP